MKRLLRQKANYSVLEGFLIILLNEPVKIVNIKDSETNKEQYQDKFNRFDIFVENANKEFIIIEIQISNEVDYFLRMVIRSSKSNSGTHV
jgi:predicted transposase/invertase (TIGR01784 family)